MKLTLLPFARAGVAVLPPDIVWTGTRGDFAPVATEADGPAGGLRGAAPLETAVVMCLGTDVRAPADDLRFEHEGDRRGWPGDGFDIDIAAGEAPMGSLFWLLRRAALGDTTGPEVEAEAERALQPLLGQGAVARIETRAAVDRGQGRVLLDVALYGRDGERLYARQFDILWSGSDGRL